MNRVLKYLLIALVLGQLVLAPFVVRAQEGDEDAEASESTCSRRSNRRYGGTLNISGGW